jgi:hypothetical protein
VVLAVISAILGNAAASDGPARTGELIPGMLTGLQVIAVLTAVGVAASLATLVAAGRRGAVEVAPE